MLGLRYLCLFFCFFVPFTIAQTNPMPEREVRLQMDSGEVVNNNPEWSIAFSDMVEVPDATALRLYFDQATLGKSADGKGATLRITSVYDGATQILKAEHLKQWRNTTAYFNGDAVVVEILSEPGMSASRVRLEKVMASEHPEGHDRSICGPDDDRELSNDPRSARFVPVGCSVWLINDEFQCFLTAGHCTGSSDIIEFNVPLSLPSGAIQHPPPEDQYIIDPFSMQSNGGQGVGNDYAYFGCFPNSNTGLTPAEAQGATYILGDPPATTAGQNIRITGYGTTTAALAPREWNQVQKTHVGPLVFATGTTLNYQADTTSANSGSPVIHENTGNAIGIHTHAGCSATSGNNGTNILFGPLQNVLANPKGICAPPLPLNFTFPNGRPELFSPDGGTLDVMVIGQNGGTPMAGTGMLHYDLEDGNGVQTMAMTEISPNLYRATIPSADCGSRILYDFSAQATDGMTVRAMDLTPMRRFIAEFATSLNTTFADDFETDMGWTVENDAALTDGAWERGVPAGAGLRQDPLTDADGSGSCFLSDNAAFNTDVDGGHTVLVSPIMDASNPESHISYWRWFFNSPDGSGDDAMVIEISNNGGTDWQVLETLGPAAGPDTTGGWIKKSFRIADHLQPSDQFRIRFDISDVGEGGIVEAGIDGVRITPTSLEFNCGPACFGDINTDGIVDQVDLGLLMAAWSTPSMLDLNADGNLDVRDLILLLDAQGSCPQ